jgi:hypothetical protein
LATMYPILAASSAYSRADVCKESGQVVDG